MSKQEILGIHVAEAMKQRDEKEKDFMVVLDQILAT